MYRTIKKLYIEPTSRCNLNCVMCFRHSWINESFGDMSLELFQRVLDDKAALNDTHTVFFGGMGEPLVHPNIIKMIACSKKRGMRTELLTNGTMLSEEVSARLIETGLDKLWVSIDSFDEESYKTIQVGSRFSFITNHIKAFNQIRRGTGTELGIGVVIMRSNLIQLESLEKYCAEIEADDVNISHMLPNTQESEADTLWKLTERAQAMETARTLGIPFEWRTAIAGQSDDDRLSESDGTVARFKFMPDDIRRLYRKDTLEGVLNEDMEVVWCGQVLERAPNQCRFIAEGNCFIRWDGAVSPCMGLLHSAETWMDNSKRTVWHHAFGNIREKSLSEIWNDKGYQDFRQQVMDFTFSPCVSCGGCELRDENKEDCLGNLEPTCGACLWGQGFIRCP